MTRNGITIPLPSELATPPASSSHTGRGSCGFRLWRYAVTAFSAGRGYCELRRLPSVRAGRSPDEPDFGSAAQRVRDLGDPVDALDELVQALARGVAIELDLVLDRLGDGRVAGEVAAHADAHARQLDPVGPRLAEEVVRDAAGDGQVEQLAAVEAEPTATAVDGAVDDERERLGAPDGGRPPGQAPRLDLEHGADSGRGRPSGTASPRKRQPSTK